MVGKAIQIQRLTKYEGRKWYRWVLVYPPRDRNRVSNDIPSTIKRKVDLFEIMRMYIVPGVFDWMPTEFKVIHMQGGRGRGFKVVWVGKIWRHDKVSPDNSKDLLSEPPFRLR